MKELPKQLKEKFIRRAIYVHSVAISPGWGAEQMEMHRMGAKDALKIFMGVEDNEIKALMEEIEKRSWSKGHISEELERILHLSLEARDNETASQKLEKWLNMVEC